MRDGVTSITKILLMNITLHEKSTFILKTNIFDMSRPSCHVLFPSNAEFCSSVWITWIDVPFVICKYDTDSHLKILRYMLTMRKQILGDLPISPIIWTCFSSGKDGWLGVFCSTTLSICTDLSNLQGEFECCSVYKNLLNFILAHVSATKTEN